MDRHDVPMDSPFDEQTTHTLRDFMDKWKRRCCEKVNATDYAYKTEESSEPFLDRIQIFPVGRVVEGMSSEPLPEAQAKECQNILAQSIQRINEAIRNRRTEEFQPSTQKTRVEKAPVPSNQPKTFIIMVPAAVSAPINLTNVAAFLNNGVYEEPSLQAFPGRPRSVSVSPEEIVGEVPHNFIVMDDPESIDADDWQNVIACFVLGKNWQFDGWFGREKGSQDPVSHILSKVKGYYIAFEGASIPKNITQWNVSVIPLYQSKKDNLTARRIWDDILWKVSTESQ
uniref:Cell division control protein 73 C-terminal domain-containing protein n=1 Tax=Paramoeba aestuarina TaxID=180227 RepID=A0A7S4PM22_9EUKA|mmetsp:Transcript_8867/g.13428  ORF Transcript_8867/g.13428 Transcript_8867/m.13428 type:complete len:284 (+) Transcript_8867:51-902(+)